MPIHVPLQNREGGGSRSEIRVTAPGTMSTPWGNMVKIFGVTENKEGAGRLHMYVIHR